MQALLKLLQNSQGSGCECCNSIAHKTAGRAQGKKKSMGGKGKKNILVSRFKSAAASVKSIGVSLGNSCRGEPSSKCSKALKRTAETHTHTLAWTHTAAAAAAAAAAEAHLSSDGGRI